MTTVGISDTSWTSPSGRWDGSAPFAGLDGYRRTWRDPLSGQTRVEPFLWTPDATRNFMADVHRAVVATQEDMARCSSKFTEAELNQWRLFRDGWSEFYKNSSEFFNTLWQATPNTTLQFNNDVLAWRQQLLKKKCVKAPPEPVPEPEPPAGDGFLEDLADILKWGVAGLGLYFGIQALGFIPKRNKDESLDGYY